MSIIDGMAERLRNILNVIQSSMKSIPVFPGTRSEKMRASVVPNTSDLLRMPNIHTVAKKWAAVNDLEYICCKLLNAGFEDIDLNTACRFCRNLWDI